MQSGHTDSANFEKSQISFSALGYFAPPADIPYETRFGGPLPGPRETNPSQEVYFHDGRSIQPGGSTPCCRPLIAYLQRRAGLSTTTRSGVHFIVDWLGWLCYLLLLRLVAFFFLFSSRHFLLHHVPANEQLPPKMNTTKIISAHRSFIVFSPSRVKIDWN